MPSQSIPACSRCSGQFQLQFSHSSWNDGNRSVPTKTICLYFFSFSFCSLVISPSEWVFSSNLMIITHIPLKLEEKLKIPNIIPFNSPSTGKAGKRKRRRRRREEEPFDLQQKRTSSRRACQHPSTSSIILK